STKHAAAPPDHLRHPCAHRRSRPASFLIAQNFSAWKQAVEACLRAAAVRRADKVATFVLTVMEGAVMQARAYRSIEPFDACVRQLRTHLSATATASRRKTRH